jgi:hypothetical protein
MLWGLLAGCGDGGDIFVDGRARDLCVEAYPTCGTVAGCLLEPERYVEGSFPGARRVVVRSETDNPALEVRLWFSELTTSGTELLVQARDPDCTLDPREARVAEPDFDLIAEAGQDRTLILPPLRVDGPGEHLIEVFLDARADYRMIVEDVGE